MYRVTPKLTQSNDSKMVANRMQHEVNFQYYQPNRVTFQSTLFNIYIVGIFFYLRCTYEKLSVIRLKIPRNSGS